MASITDSKKRTPGLWATWFFVSYLYTSAAMCIGMGLLMFYATGSTDPLLARMDAVFGIKNETLLWLAGSMYLSVSVLIFKGLLKEDVMSGVMATLWVGVNSLAYVGGMLWGLHQDATSGGAQQGAGHPFQMVILTGRQASINPQLFNAYWKGFISYLIVGSLLSILLAFAIQWRWNKLDKEADWWDQWRASRKFPVK